MTGTSVDQLYSLHDITADPDEIDPDEVADDARVGHEILLAVSATVGTLLVLLRPVRRRARRLRHHPGGRVLPGRHVPHPPVPHRLGGARRPRLRASSAWSRSPCRCCSSTTAGAPAPPSRLAGVGAVLLALTLVPASPSVRRGRIGDVVETMTLLVAAPADGARGRLRRRGGGLIDGHQEGPRRGPRLQPTPPRHRLRLRRPGRPRGRAGAPGRVLIGGIALSVLLLAGAAIAGFLLGRPPAQWLDAGQLRHLQGHRRAVRRPARRRRPDAPAGAQLRLGPAAARRGRAHAVHRPRQVHPHGPARRGPRHRRRTRQPARRRTSWSTTAGPPARRTGVGIKVAVQRTPTVEDLTGSAFLVEQRGHEPWLIATAPPVGQRAGQRLPLPDARGRDAVLDAGRPARLRCVGAPRSTDDWLNLFRLGEPLEEASFGVTRPGRARALRQHRHRPLALPHRRPAALQQRLLLPPRRREARAAQRLRGHGLRRRRPAGAGARRATSPRPSATPTPRRVAQPTLPPPITNGALCAVLHPATGADARFSLATNPTGAADPDRTIVRPGRHEVDVEPSAGAYVLSGSDEAADAGTPLRHRHQGREVRAGRARRCPTSSATATSSRRWCRARGWSSSSRACRCRPTARAGCPRTPRRRTTRPRTPADGCTATGRRLLRLPPVRTTLAAGLLAASRRAARGALRPPPTTRPCLESRGARLRAAGRHPHQGQPRLRADARRAGAGARHRPGREGRRHRQRDGRHRGARHRRRPGHRRASTPTPASPATARSSPDSSPGRAASRPDAQVFDVKVYDADDADTTQGERPADLGRHRRGHRRRHPGPAAAAVRRRQHLPRRPPARPGARGGDRAPRGPRGRRGGRRGQRPGRHPRLRLRGHARQRRRRLPGRLPRRARGQRDPAR